MVEFCCARVPAGCLSTTYVGLYIDRYVRRFHARFIACAYYYSMAFKATTDHDEIRAWIEKHGGVPVVVRGTTNGDQFGVLSIHFGSEDPDLEQISWEDFFDRFDGENLIFRYNNFVIPGEEELAYSLAYRNNISEGTDTDIGMDDNDNDSGLPEENPIAAENEFSSNEPHPPHELPPESDAA